MMENQPSENSLPTGKNESNGGKRWRKFSLAILIFLVASFLVWDAKISEKVFESITFLCGGGFLIADVSEKKLMKG